MNDLQRPVESEAWLIFLTTSGIVL